MKNDYSRKVPGSYIIYFLIIAAGCFYMEGCIPMAKYEKTVNLSEPMTPDSLFEAKTHNGYLNIIGADVTECSVTAIITARATTEEKAQKLAEKVEVKLVQSGNGLAVKIEKPKLIPYQNISVSLDVKVPNQTNTELITHNGALKIKNLNGRLDGTTHNGQFTAENISGQSKLKAHNGKILCKGASDNTQLQTHNGSIICEEVSGDINLRTHNGSAKAFYSTAAPPVCNISIVSHNGGVSLTAPPNLSAKIDVSTHNGSIKTDLPVTIIGKLSKRKLTGTIGTGQGRLYLETHNGSITIK
jgi:DUF4097 and DUF4098 domain-containing protein YvlB